MRSTASLPLRGKQRSATRSTEPRRAQPEIDHDDNPPRARYPVNPTAGTDQTSQLLASAWSPDRHEILAPARGRCRPEAKTTTRPGPVVTRPVLRGRRSVALSGLWTVAEGGVPAARPQFCASSPASRRTAHASGATAASTSPESVAPASKCRPSTAKTITRCGSRCRTRASSMASWSPKAWVDAKPRKRTGSGSLLASNRRIVPGGSPEHIVSTSTTASRPCMASSRSFGSHRCSLTSIPALRSAFVQSSHDLLARAVVAA